MAKIRVYELARDLNMTNKMLMDKILGMNIDVKSHMSSLEDDMVSHIKAHVLGRKKNELEEKRVQPTIIRRRKVAAPEAAAPTASEAAAAEPVAEPELIQTAKLMEESKVEAKLPEAARPEQQKMPEPEVPAAPESVEIETAPEPVETPAVVEAVAARPEKPVVRVEAVAGPIRTPLEEIPVQPEASAPAAEPSLLEAEKEERPDRLQKKTKKRMAAKIISLPERPKLTPAETEIMEEAPLVQAPETVVVSAELPALTEEGEDPDDRRGKKKKKLPEVEKDKKFFKKKIAFKKKSIVEGKELYDDELVRGRKAKKGAKNKAPVGQKTQITVPKAIKRRVKIDDAIILSDLSKRMGIKSSEMIQKLMGMGVMATVNQTIDYDTAALVAAEFGYETERAGFEEAEILGAQEDKPEELIKRPPVVTIMGHVDHGKTSLLDVIRKSSVTADEAGGITQHIGAYNVQTEKGLISFLDTPGHEAFTAMRSRGAQVTDIVILVVAADDGVMPQTIEAINHAKAAGVPIIVAVNKIDKPDAEPERVKRELADHNVLSEEWGGETIFVNVSAKQNIGIDDLLDMVLLQAEMMELKANPDKLARGHVIEAKLDSGRGPVATVLVKEGTLHAGDSIVCGIHYGKVRAMLNDKGQPIESAGPSIPVEVLGLNGVPGAGDEMITLEDEKNAKQVSMHRQQKQRAKDLAKSSRLSLEGLFEKLEEGEVKDLNLIIKADVHGSIEALKDSLIKLSSHEVKINVVHAATGTVSESDVSLAAVMNAIIVGFNVRPSAKVQEMASEEHVDMRFYNIIYNAIKDIKDAMVGMMDSKFVERVLGRAEVREVFMIPKVGAIAGSYVTEGKIERNQHVRLLREGVIIYDGKISSLRRYKDDAREVLLGYECGIGIENFNDIKIGDEIECYYLEEIKPTME